MKCKKLINILVMTLALLFAPFAFCQAAVIDVTNLTLNGSVLTVNAVLDSGNSAMDAAGFKLTFPADRLQFIEVADVPGAMIHTQADGSTLQVGFTNPGTEDSRVELAIRFTINGQGPYLLSVDPTGLTDKISNASGNRPGITGITGMTQPVIWNVPDALANLFLIIPRVTQVTGLSLEISGQDILAGLLSVSCWYWDEVQDVAYLVLPGMELPQDTYTVAGQVVYGNEIVNLSADVQVR